MSASNQPKEVPKETAFDRQRAALKQACDALRYAGKKAKTRKRAARAFAAEAKARKVLAETKAGKT